MKQASASTKTIAIIPSGGLGLRMGLTPFMGEKKKNYLPLLGKPILAHTLAALEDSPHISSVIIAVTPGDETFCLREIVEKHGFKKVAAVLITGKVDHTIFVLLQSTRDREQDGIAQTAAGE